MADRVYGDPSWAFELWRANRDGLPTPESPLPDGFVLRTPPLPAADTPSAPITAPLTDREP
ncbi:MAG: hypothetical protein KatS3mg108_3156 [Isosphaeraceae bacterium]|nr:MAG: hypothetical protein KatS3mg108_3156 [Isosphaeraceae bacterium]